MLKSLDDLTCDLLGTAKLAVDVVRGESALGILGDWKNFDLISTRKNEDIRFQPEKKINISKY